MTDFREDIILKLGRNPLLAHRTLFAHRHPEETQSFHDQMILDWHSLMPNVIDFVFRGGGKSTTAEEAICVMACLQKFHNALIIGETETRAKERLSSIKHEFETNEDILSLFGNMIGARWQEGAIELSNGVVIQAYGRGQSLRGVKHLHYRPDIAFCDDLEDEESVKTPETRKKTLDWFLKTLIPAMDPRGRIRMAATPLHQEALALKLKDLPNWTCRIFPICYKNEDGEEVSSWPDRYSMDWINSKRKEYEDLGEKHSWLQEYMCIVENPEDKTFTSDMFRYEPIVRAWQPVYVVYDPARTVKKTSASTGKVVGSWVNNRLIIWEAKAEMWRPDEIIDDIFKTDERYNPIAIGVEENGLHEFIMQPLRHGQIARGHQLPIRPLMAPRGKIDFIRGLQPFFKAGEVIFAGERSQFSDMEKQLLGFPTGKIDAPNALAYFLNLRPGIAMYDGFNPSHILESCKIAPRHPIYLCVNATPQVTTAILVQVYDGILSVVGDIIREGDPGLALEDIIREAGPMAGKPFTAIAGPKHFQAYDNIGLRGAARKIPLELRMGGQELTGREEIRQLLKKLSHGQPALRVATAATWTLKAFTGGYAREVGKNVANDNVYRVLCEGLETFAATFSSGMNDEVDKNVRYGHTDDGRRFITARVST